MGARSALMFAETPRPGREAPQVDKGAKRTWSLVTGLTVGNQYIAADKVSAIFGGRAGYPQLTVKGA